VLAARAQETLPPPEAGTEEIRRAADEILARPEFQEPPRSLYQQALDWVTDRIADAVNALVSGGTGALVAWALLVAFVVLVVFLVARTVQGDRRRSSGGAGVGVDIEADDRRPAEAWAADAARFEGEGRWREAIRCRYRAIVAGLARSGVVDEVPGRTAGEYRVLVGAARPAVAEPFAGATDLFERAWYGEEAGPEGSRSIRDLGARVETAAGNGAGARPPA
jgi:hypothetical protein